MSLHRLVFLNLTRIRYPVGAVASIGHRISGIVLVLALPFAVLGIPGWMRLPAALLAWAAARGRGVELTVDPDQSRHKGL